MFKNSISRNIQLLGLVFFVFYGVLALLFYKERMLSFDSAAYALEIIQTKTYFIPLGRWGVVFSQTLPLLFLKAGCSLATFLQVYSVSFILIYYIGFLITNVLLKSNRGGIIYLLAFCLTTRHTFYFAIAEIPFGLLLVVLLYAMMEYLLNEDNKRKHLVFLLSFVVVFGLYYFHQLMFIAILFMLLVVYFSYKDYKNLKVISLFAFTLIWFGANILLLANDSYGAKKIPWADIFVQELPHFFDLPSFKYFFIHFKNELLVPFAVAVGGGLILIFKRKFFLLTLFLGVPLAYLVLIIITYSNGEAPNMYELYYVMFGLFLALLINSSRTTKISNNYLIYLVIPLLLYSSQRIYAAHYLPTKRVEYISLLAKYGKKLPNRKYIIHPDDFPWGYAWGTWAIPSEVLLISSLENKDNGGGLLCPRFWRGG